MIKNLLISIIALSLLSACGGSSSSSSGTGTNATASSAATSNCGVGTYAFTTVSDGRKHFDAFFAPGGQIRFNLEGGPTGTWSYSGNRMSVTGPLSSSRQNITLNFTVTRVASDCKVMEFRGTSPGGASMRMYRI